ncbi:hypothetical protein GEMRC1_005469 [Eukaryota sp. GEM-RC1]
MSLVPYDDSSSSSEEETTLSSSEVLPKSLFLASTSSIAPPPFKKPRNLDCFGLEVSSSSSGPIQPKLPEPFKIDLKSRVFSELIHLDSQSKTVTNKPETDAEPSLVRIEQKDIGKEGSSTVIPGKEAWGGARVVTKSVDKEMRSRGHLLSLLEKAKRDAPKISMKKQEQQKRKALGRR